VQSPRAAHSRAASKAFTPADAGRSSASVGKAAAAAETQLGWSEASYNQYDQMLQREALVPLSRLIEAENKAVSPLLLHVQGTDLAHVRYSGSDSKVESVTGSSTQLLPGSKASSIVRLLNPQGTQLALDVMSGERPVYGDQKTASAMYHHVTADSAPLRGRITSLQHEISSLLQGTDFI